MRQTMTVLLMIFLASCNAAQRSLICKQVESATFTPKPMYDVSFKFDRCRVRCFDMTNWQELPIGSCPELEPEAREYGVGFDSIAESISLPIEACEGVAGFTLIDIAKDIKPKIVKLGAIRRDQCRSVK